MADLSISLFAADILHMEENLHLLDDVPVFSLHVDIMDCHFVPLCGFNPIWPRCIQSVVPLRRDFHFMAYVTDEMLQTYMRLDPERIILHTEAQSMEKNMELLHFIKSRGIETGIAVSPGTEAQSILPYLGHVDDILVMSTHPGRENSVFLEESFGRIREIRKLIRDSGKQVSVSVDGGLNQERAEECVSGADRVIMGRAFFGCEDRQKLVKEILEAG